MIDEVGVALIAAFITAVLGVLGLRRAWRADKAAQEAGIETRTGQSIQQAIDGMDNLVTALQKRVENLEGRLDDSEEAEAECKREIEVLARRIATLTEGTS